MVDGVKVCGGCRSRLENLPEHVVEAIMELPADQVLSIQVGLCDGCSLSR
ncbi:hypothetical protein GMSM_44600 [Geomonas sp. Red276]